MDLTTVPRTLIKLEYAGVRLPFAFLDDCVLALYYDEDVPPRSGLRHFLGELDEFAGWLLADEDIARRGETLLRETRARRPNGTTGAPPEPAEPAEPAEAAGGPTGETGDTPAAAEPAPPDLSVPEPVAPDLGVPEPVAPDLGVPQPVTPDLGGPEPVAPALGGPVAPEPVLPELGVPETVGPEQEQEAASAAAPGSVDIAFLLPADVGAGRVALCGDFNDWSPDATALERGDDGAWRVSVPLEPGRSYRYRYLLDGERWENGGQADRYEPNPYGGVDSVVVIE